MAPPTRSSGQLDLAIDGPSIVRSRLAATAASIIAHAIALIWITGHPGVLAGAARAVPPRVATETEATAATDPEPLEIELLDADPPPPREPARAPPPHPTPIPRPWSAVAARTTTAPSVAPPQPAVATAAGAAAAPAADVAPSPVATPSTAAGTAPSAGDAALVAGPARSDGPGGHGEADAGRGTPATRVLERFPRIDMRVAEPIIEAIVARERSGAADAASAASSIAPWRPAPQLTGLAGLAPGDHTPETGSALDQDSARREREVLAMTPAGGGRYHSDEPSFSVDIAADGTVAIHDKPPIRLQGMGLVFDLDAVLMRAHGADPYRWSKQHFLDQTRDQRAEIGKRYRTEQLARSAELMLANIDRVWATVRDPVARREALFELWDDCAETGDDELLAGADAARRIVIGAIQGRLRGAQAYTPEELARLNARRTSATRFAPYDLPPAP